MEGGLTNITHYEADDLIIAVEVTFEPGSPITALTGGTVEAFAERQGAARIAANSCTILDADSVLVAFNEGTLTEGVYTLQVRATVSGVTQTIADATVTVRGSV